jgi:hypothetical protein
VLHHDDDKITCLFGLLSIDPVSDVSRRSLMSQKLEGFLDFEVLYIERSFFKISRGPMLYD